MGIVYFTSGREVILSQRDTDNFVTRMKEGGVRMVKTRDTDPQQVIVISQSPVSHVVMDYKHTPQPLYDVEVEPDAPEIKVEEKKKSIQERAEEVLVDMTAKANCKHESDKIIYYKKEMGAKGNRYFPMCSFCGWKGKFAAAEDLSDSVKNAALVYQED
jgi:hypothetical protein